MIAGALGKLVDALLVDVQPGGAAEFFADIVFEFCYGYERHKLSLIKRVFLFLGDAAPRL
jgi:hypothetical protein